MRTVFPDSPPWLARRAERRIRAADRVRLVQPMVRATVASAIVVLLGGLIPDEVMR